MARLKDVKVVDMVDGEITKISYRGEEYIFTEDVNKYGDIELVVEPRGSQIKGEYYAVIAERGVDCRDGYETRIVFIRGEIGEADGYRSDVGLVCRVTTASLRDGWEDLDERVTALEGKDVEEEVFSEGDYVKVVGETYYGTIGMGFDLGTIAKVGNHFNRDAGYRIELLDGTDFDRALAESLEKCDLTDREISFLRAGRDIGEVKPGDIDGQS